MSEATEQSHVMHGRLMGAQQAYLADNTLCWLLSFESIEHQLSAYWLPTEGDNDAWELPAGTPCRVRVAQYTLDGGELVWALTDLEPLNWLDDPVHFIPASLIRLAIIPEALRIMLEFVQIPALHEFLHAVFSDEQLILPFIQIPASRAHHHSYPGGLFQHSMEMWLHLHDVVEHESESGQLAMVATLLHDLGKIRTLEVDGSHTQSSYILPHEALTLELLAPHLRALDARWPSGADALRYLLTWKPGQGGSPFPLLPVANLLRAADHYSAARSAEQMAFEGAPPIQRSATLEGSGRKNRFWRPVPAPVD